MAEHLTVDQRVAGSTPASLPWICQRAPEQPLVILQSGAQENLGKKTDLRTRLSVSGRFCFSYALQIVKNFNYCYSL